MSNVDIDEVNKFAALASRWWDKNSEFKPLHDINPLKGRASFTPRFEQGPRTILIALPLISGPFLRHDLLPGL
jgi:2-polyprenyl-3-methyl-5-hydroxy-6-metoxy-1,4-benzoquinol methylase